MDPESNGRSSSVEKPVLPALLLFFIESLIPTDNSLKIQADLRKHRDALGYLTAALQTIPIAIAGEARTAFDSRKVIGEICCLCFGFVGSLLYWRPMAAIVLISLIAFRIRDALTHSVNGGLAEAATDGLVMAASAGLSQMFFIAVMPALALPPVPLVHGIALGMLLAAFWRLACQLNTPISDPEKTEAAKIYRASMRITAFWVVAWLGLVYSNKELVQGLDFVAQFALGALPLVLGGVAYRYMVGGPSIFHDEFKPESIDPEKQSDPAIERKIGSLPDTNPRLSERKIRVVAEISAFASILLPVVIGVWRWYTGQGEVFWGQIFGNLAALAGLAALWFKIKEKNRQTARDMIEKK